MTMSPRAIAFAPDPGDLVPGCVGSRPTTSARRRANAMGPAPVPKKSVVGPPSAEHKNWCCPRARRRRRAPARCIAGRGGALAQDVLQLHGDAHVALDLELAGHERGHAVELAADHVGEVAEIHLDRAVGRLVVVAHRRRILVAVDVDHALVRGELHGISEGRLLRRAFLHFCGEFLQGHGDLLRSANGPQWASGGGLLDLYVNVKYRPVNGRSGRGGNMAYRSVFKPGLFEGQTIIVTGGGSGIGRCTAHEIASLGAHVVIAGRKPDKLEAVKGEIEASGGSCDTQPFDIREEAQVKEAIARIVAVRGPIHGLFNNAGGQFPAPAAAMRNGFPNMAHTCAARAGMVNLTMTLAHEWAHAGVRVNAVSPGWIASSGMDTYQGEFKEQIPRLKDYCPLGRLGTESEVSAAVCFLLSDAAAYITGTEIRIDGGVPLGNRSMELPKVERTSPFNGFHLAVTPKVLGG